MDTPFDTTKSQGPNLPRTPRRLSRRLLGGLAALVVGGALSFSVAQAHGFGGGEGPMAGRMHHMLDKVGATDGQRAQIKAVWEGIKPQLKALHAQHAQLREQLTQALTAQTIDPAAVEKLRQQSVQTMDKVSSALTHGFVETARVLTPEQRKQVAAELQKESEHRHEHFEEHGGPEGF
jgi:protein CpxP